MTKYREIIGAAGLILNQINIALIYNASETTVNKILKVARNFFRNGAHKMLLWKVWVKVLAFKIHHTK